ncbi:MAG: esterase-like activity of phytase family protein, partial [Gammaproteobacteria bacterium]
AVATLSNISVDGLKVSELSGLSWDQDEGLLYALSDNGYILDLQPLFRKGELQDVLLIAGHRLLDDKGRPLKFKPADSEGVAVENARNGKQGDSRLVVSFERFPRLVRYKPDGTLEATVAMPGELEDVTRYRSENNGLESVTIHNTLGIIVGTEFPLDGSEPGTLNLYTTQGQHWAAPLHDKTYGALVDMTTLEDGRIIALERAYNGLLSGINTSLHRITLKGNTIVADRIYTFTPEDGLFNDNFEGLAHLDQNRFMMISDDNNHPLKRTLLVYFEIKERK